MCSKNILLSFSRSIKIANESDASLCKIASYLGEFISFGTKMMIEKKGERMKWYLSLPLSLSSSIPSKILSISELVEDDSPDEINDGLTHYYISSRNKFINSTLNKSDFNRVIDSPRAFPLEVLFLASESNFSLWFSIQQRQINFATNTAGSTIYPIEITSNNESIAIKISEWLNGRYYSYEPNKKVTKNHLEVTHEEMGYIFRPPYSTEKMVFYNEVQNQDIIKYLRNSPQSLTKHVFLTGKPGSGKTKTTQKILSNIVNSIKTLFICDIKGEYKVISKEGLIKFLEPATNIAALKNFGNPFQPGNQVRLLSHINDLAEVIATGQFGTSGVALAKYFALLLEDFYTLLILQSQKSKPNWEHFLANYENSIPKILNSTADELKNQFLPDLFKLFNLETFIKFWFGYKERFVEKVFTGGRSQQDILDVINSRIRSLKTSFFVYFDYDTNTSFADSFKNSKIILSLKGCSLTEIKSLMSMFALLYLNSLLSEDDYDGLKGLIVLEEVHTIAKKDFQGGNEVVSSGKLLSESLERSLAELRSRGYGFIILDQSPAKLIDGVIANTGIKICHNLGSGADQHQMADSIGLADHSDLSFLDVGECIVKIDGSLPFTNQIRL